MQDNLPETTFETASFIARDEGEGRWFIYSKDTGALLASDIACLADVVAKIAKLDVTVGPHVGQRNVFSNLAHRLDQEDLVRMSPEQYTRHCDTQVKHFLPYRRAQWM